MSSTTKVEDWLSACQKKTRVVYQRYFTVFAEFAKLTPDEMLSLKAEEASAKLFAFYQHLASGEVHAYLYSTKYHSLSETNKPLSQNTCRSAITAVQSFFSFYERPINLKKYLRKAPKLQRPQPEKRKRLLTANEVESLFRFADARDKAMLGLACMGQDRSTIVSLKVEIFEGKLGETQIEFIDALRPKSNLPIKILLTREMQGLLTDYITSLRRHEGWLFNGYKNQALKPQEVNDTFKRLCGAIGLANNGKRLSSHCLRMWFSTALRNKVSDDIIDLCTGHVQRYGGAYLGDDEQKLRQLLTEADAENLLRLQTASAISKDLPKKVEQQEQTIARLSEMVENQEKMLLEYLKKEPDTKTKVRDVKPFTPKSETEILREEVAELRKTLEEMKKKD